MVLGPNINMPMPPEAERPAHDIIRKAVALKNTVSEREQAYIDALAKRYSGEENPNRSILDRAYADAMRELHDRFPNDLDAATLYAEAVMNLRPWNYWTRDMNPWDSATMEGHSHVAIEAARKAASSIPAAIKIIQIF